MYVSVSRSKAFDAKTHTRFDRARVPSLDAFQAVMVSDIWSPIIWQEDYRLRDNFFSCKYAALDFDNGALTLDKAAQWCVDHGYSAIIGTSKSHQLEKRTPAGKVSKPCDRFRLVLPFAEVITSRQAYEFNMRFLMQLLPADGSCVDAARFFYPCKTITYCVGGGAQLPVVTPEPVDERAVDDNMLEAMRRGRHDGVYPAWITSVLTHGCEEGGRHKLCYRLGANLTHAGFSNPEIVALIMKSPLSVIGKSEVERAVDNGAARSRDRVARNRGQGP